MGEAHRRSRNKYIGNSDTSATQFAERVGFMKRKEDIIKNYGMKRRRSLGMKSGSRRRPDFPPNSIIFYNILVMSIL